MMLMRVVPQAMGAMLLKAMAGGPKGRKVPSFSFDACAAVSARNTLSNVGGADNRVGGIQVTVPGHRPSVPRLARGSAELAGTPRGR